MILDIALVALGGAAGSVARYLVTLACTRLFGTEFAWGTLSANLIGCFLIGIVLGLFSREVVSTQFKVFFVTGFLGGLTTFSSYAADTAAYFRDGLILKASLNILANNVAGLVFALAGFAIVLKRA